MACLPGGDVIGLDRCKLCGGAQRRTRRGFLHQGSIQNLRLPADFAARLLKLLAVRTLRFSPDLATLARTQELASEKYGTIAWLAKVS
jgi:lipoate-protein ligase A